MRRGDVVLVALQGDFGKPRPAVVVQSDLVGEPFTTLAVCPCTTHLIDAPDIRPRVRPSGANGLDAVSEIAVDKIAVVRRDKLRGPVGRLEDPDIGRVNFALLMFLGLP